MFRVKMTGMDKLNRRLLDLSRKAKELGDTHSIPLAELLTPAFISTYTRFSSMEEMFEMSGFNIKTQEDLDALPAKEMDDFIRSVSSFTGWRAMLQEAVKAWTARRLGF